jgi:acetyl esterase/lipase
MDRRMLRRLLVLLDLIIGLAAAAAIATGLQAETASVAAQRITPQVMDRGTDPVVIAGATVTAMVGLPTDELFVYAYDAGAWRQIPSQVDELAAAGTYVATEDGRMDENDEIVFMAKDLGDRMASTLLITGSLSLGTGWYEIEVIDPLSPTQKGWAYLIHSKVLTSSAPEDYVEYIPWLHRITTTDYTLGFGAAIVSADYLALGGSGVDILDRHKIRIDCRIGALCPMTEDRFLLRPDDVVRDGPVRVIARGGDVLAYGAMLQHAAPLDIPRPLLGSVRLSLDFNQQATGAIFYSAVVTDGVTVDGITDTVPATPYSPWWQLSTVSGTIVFVGEASSAGVLLTNYYVDNADYDPSDTGDQQHYGDVGVVIDNADPSFIYTGTLYFLSGSHPNVGAAYEARRTHPLSVTAVLFGDPRPPGCTWNEIYDDFYEPPPLGTLLPDQLGEVLRVEHIRSYSPGEVASLAGLAESSYGAEAYRILYLSQKPSGALEAVSGLLIVPIGLSPQEGFPVITYGHGTAGLADVCAPSRYDADVLALVPWAAYGYMVSASDYSGLGTPGPHPYGVGESEARSLLDAARAAQGFCDRAHGILEPWASNRVFLMGFSQGAHAALFAHQIWQSYAPELDIVGTVTFAPGSELRLLTQRLAQGESLLAAPAAMAMYSYREYYGAPADLSVWLREPYASQLPSYVEKGCLLGLALWTQFDTEAVFQPELISAAAHGRWDELEPFTTYLDTNTPQGFGSDVPVFIGQGQRDLFVLPEMAQQLTRRLCDEGAKAKLVLYKNATHALVSAAARSDALAWMADRLAGVPAPDSCEEVKLRTYLPIVVK